MALLTLSAAAPAMGQARIEGRVTDEAGAALPGVNVWRTGSQEGTATLADGTFAFETRATGRVVIRASAVGYAEAEAVVTVAPGATVRLDFTLREVVLDGGEVVVTANRRAQRALDVPVTIEVLSTADLEARNIITVDQALRYLPGVQVQENQVNIRGSSGFSYNVGSRVLMMLDGFPLLAPDTDGIPFDALPITQIEQIEVLKGPGSALYGGGALGGVIQVLTADPGDEPVTKLQLYGGVHPPTRYDVWREAWDGADSYKPMGGLTLGHSRRVSPKLSFWINADVQLDDGYTDFSSERLARLFTKWLWSPTGQDRFEFMLGARRINREAFLFWNGARAALSPGQLGFTRTTDPNGTSDNVSTSGTFFASYTRLFNTQSFLTARLRSYALLLQPIRDGAIEDPDRGTYGIRLGGEVQYHLRPTPTRYLTLGAAGDGNSTYSSFFVSPDGNAIGTQPETAVFGQWEEQVGRLTLIGGLRWDRYQVDVQDAVSEVSPRFSISVPLGADQTTWLAYAEGFRVPSFAERFVDNRSFLPIVSNYTLRPETSNAIELGYRTQRQVGATPITVTATAFTTRYDDLIEPVFTSRSSAFQFVNLTQARVTGAEASVEAIIPNGPRLLLGYTFTEAVDLDADAPLTNRPDHLISMQFQTPLGRGFGVGIDARYISTPERLDSDFVRFVPDADVLLATQVVDARLTYRRAQTEIGALMMNAFDYHYLERPAFLAPPRHFILRLSTSF
ncbi:MAG: TonB-dependent receptor [Bacteroidota bacterium]